MSEYGLTSKGVNIKRLDVILEEMQKELSERWGVNVMQNQKSFLNVHLTDLADHFAELWEFGQDIYNSQYPLTAEGMYLDGVGQFAGIWRETDAPSYYHILCTGKEGTTIPADTIISTDTNPATYFEPTKANTISRTCFSKVLIKVVSLDGNPLTVAINGRVYSHSPAAGETEAEALSSLSLLIGNGFTASIESGTGHLLIESEEEVSINGLTLSDSLTTETVGCVFTFGTQEDGDIYLPEGAINQIKKSVVGLYSVTNVGSYIAGRLEETDPEFRASYAKKIFSHSSRMGDSIKSAILSNCQGVSAVAVYENVSNTVDEYGRYPHSVEVVVDGGDSSEIAEQILATKAGGINTYGSTEVDITTLEEDTITIRFNRPTYKKVWFHVGLSLMRNASLQEGYADTIRGIITDALDELECGENLNPQSLFLKTIYQKISGISYIDISMGVGDSEPSEYTEHIIYSGVRERAITDNSMIEVVING